MLRRISYVAPLNLIRFDCFLYFEVLLIKLKVVFDFIVKEEAASAQYAYSWLPLKKLQNLLWRFIILEHHIDKVYILYKCVLGGNCYVGSILFFITDCLVILYENSLELIKVLLLFFIVLVLLIRIQLILFHELLLLADIFLNFSQLM